MIRCIVVGLVLLGSPLPTVADEAAGQVVFVAGSVTAERGDVVELKKTDPVFEKDIVVTAARSRGQLLMRDGAKFALRPETRFIVEEYFLAGDERTQLDGSVIVASGDSAVTELIKGGFRTITGAVGKDDPDAYEVKTPAATMGIRGTHYAVMWCVSCALPPGADNKKPILDGLYLGVSEGIVVIRNQTGEYTVSAGQFVYVKDRSTPPVRLTEMPVALIDTYSADDALSDEAAEEISETIAALGATAVDVGLGSGANPSQPGFAARPRSSGPGGSPDSTTVGSTKGTTSGSTSGSASGSASGSGTTSGSTGSSGNGTAAGTTPGGTGPRPGPSIGNPDDGSTNVGFEGEPEAPILIVGGGTLTGGILPRSRPVALASGPVNGLSTTVFTGSSNSGTRAFSGNDLTQFQSPPTTTTTTYAIGTAGLRDDGFDPVTGIGWGRWTGQAATATRDGVVTSIDLGMQSLHWAYGPDSAPLAMPIMGTANFRLIAGNTDPTDTLGRSGVLGSASLLANFTTATVQSELSLAIAGLNWNAAGSGTISSNLFSGAYSNVLVGGQGGGTGNFSGFFTAPAVNGLPNGAGLTYGLMDSQGSSVSGVVVFGPASP